MTRCRLVLWSLTLTATKLQSRLFLSLKAPEAVFVFSCVFVSSWCYFVVPYRYNKRIHEITRKHHASLSTRQVPLDSGFLLPSAITGSPHTNLSWRSGRGSAASLAESLWLSETYILRLRLVHAG